MKRGSERALGFLLATAFWIFVFATGSTRVSFKIDDYSGWITALASVAIAGFTFTLWRSTDKLWKAGENQFRLAKETSDRQAIEIRDQLEVANKASDAAQKSADAAVAAERAWLYVEIDHNFMDCIQSAYTRESTKIDDSPVAASNTPMAKIKFRNYGKTPAVVSEVGLCIVYSGLLVPDPVYDVKVVNVNTIGPDQTTEEFTPVLRGQMTLGQAKAVRDGNGSIYVAGYISYHDVFRELRTHRFFQRLVRVHPGDRYVLQASDFKHYNIST